MTFPYYPGTRAVVYNGDCLDILKTLPDASVDAVVTDPPYGIRFMGKPWDGLDIEAGVELRRSQAAMPNDGKAGVNGGYRSAATEAGRYDLSMTANQTFQAWCTEWTTECLRTLKPGGHLLSFGGSRTWHRLASAVEDAGFEIRDSIAWLYGSGFPKSLDVSKAIDRRLGAADEDPSPSTPEGRQWEGWSTALKPAFEPIVVGRRPLMSTVAASVLEHGTGALNIDACRTPAGRDYADKCASVVGLGSNRSGDTYGEWTGVREDSASPAGRWPTNVVLDETQAAELDEQAGIRRPGERPANRAGLGYNGGATGTTASRVVLDSGGASRFFPVFRYQAKAPAKERPRVDGVAHPTVKPLELMRWLVRLVTPPGGVVLEPFAGSGTTVEAALLEGFHCVTIEREADYLPLIFQRIQRVTPGLGESTA